MQIDEQTIFKYLCKIHDDIILLICVIFLLIGGYTCYDNYQLYYHAQDKSILKYKPHINSDGTIDTPEELSQDLVAWVTLNDTSIDYPIMQAEDNNKYLNMDPYGNYSLSGSIFLDSRNSPDFTDHYNITYGHHMENGYMFGALDEYLKKPYFDSHRHGTLIILNKDRTGQVCELNIFGVMYTNANDTVFDPNNEQVTYDYIRDNADIYVEPTDRSNVIVALSTCQSSETTGRLLVFAEIKRTSKTTSLEEENSVEVIEEENKEVAPAEVESTGSCYVHWIIFAISLIAAIASLILKDSSKLQAVVLVICTLICALIAVIFGKCNIDYFMTLGGTLMLSSIAISNSKKGGRE